MLLAATMLRCGLSADGQGTREMADGGSHGGSSGTSSGVSSGGFGSSGDDGGTSSGTTSSSSGSGTSSGFAMGDASDPLDAHGLEGAAPSFDGSASGGHVDGGSGDGAASGMYCKRLNNCCGMLQTYGAAAMSVMTCQQSAQAGDENSCQFLLQTFQSAYLCFGV